MNNLLLHCGLVDARINASEKELPVTKLDYEAAQPRLARGWLALPKK